MAATLAVLAFGPFGADGAAANLYKDGTFKIKAPSGWSLMRTAKGNHELTCSQARVGFGIYKRTAETPKVVGLALIREMGLSKIDVRRTGKSYAASVGGTPGGVLRTGGVSVSLHNGLLRVRSWVTDATGSEACFAPDAPGSVTSSIDSLAVIAGGAEGGVPRKLKRRQVTFPANTPVPMQRYEVCATAPAGSQPCSSGLVPDTWFPIVYASPGFLEGIGRPSTGERGEFTLGGNALVYDPTCTTGQPGGNGTPMEAFTNDPVKAVENVFPKQWAYAAQLGGASLYTPISAVHVVSTLRNPWLAGQPASGLYLVRWTQDATEWTAVFGASVVGRQPDDRCFWRWHFSFVAVPDGGPPGLASALIQTWASWRQTASSGATNATEDPGSPSPEAATGALGAFSLHNAKGKLFDLRDIAS